MAAPTTPGIVTPEAVLLDFDTAGAGSRTLAIALDILLQVTALSFVSIALFGAAGALGSLDWLAVVLALVLFLAVLVGYPVLMETLWGGRTLGKAALGLRVVTVEGGPERFRHAMIRGVVGLVEIYIFLGVPALLAVIFSSRDQRLGDMVAGTLVLRERDALKAGRDPQLFLPPPGYREYAQSLDTSGLTERQYQVARNFLLRCGALTPAARTSIGVNIANAVAGAIRHQPPPMVPPETFLVCTCAAYQLRHGLVPPEAWAPPPPPPPGSWMPAPPAAPATAGTGWAPPPPPAATPPPPPGGAPPPAPPWQRPGSTGTA